MPIIAGPAKPSHAESVARSLASKFMEKGNYEALGMPLSNNAIIHYTQAASTLDVDNAFEEESGFSGLAVHSVGYTADADDEEVIIYVTKGSKKARPLIESISRKRIDGVQIKAMVLGKLKAGPVPAMAAQGLGNLFERNGRIACGSSCCPEWPGACWNFLVRYFDETAKWWHYQIITFLLLVTIRQSACPSFRRAQWTLGPDAAVRQKFYGLPFAGVELSGVGDPALVPLMRFDAALGQVVDQNVVSSWQGDDAKGFDTPTLVANPIANQRVKKAGRTTGVTIGVCEHC